jgi:molecular chaperone DnaK
MAENLVHASRKSMQELGEKATETEKQDIEAAIADVEEAIKGDDKSAIEAKTQKLGEVAGKLAERVYQQNAEQAQAGAGDNPEAEKGNGEDKENVVDAEFEEVDNDKK